MISYLPYTNTFGTFTQRHVDSIYRIFFNGIINSLRLKSDSRTFEGTLVPIWTLFILFSLTSESDTRLKNNYTADKLREICPTETSRDMKLWGTINTRCFCLTLTALPWTRRWKRGSGETEFTWGHTTWLCCITVITKNRHPDYLEERKIDSALKVSPPKRGPNKLYGMVQQDEDSAICIVFVAEQSIDCTIKLKYHESELENKLCPVRENLNVLQNNETHRQ